MPQTNPIRKSSDTRSWLGWLVIVILGFALSTSGPPASATDTLSIGDFLGHFRGEAQVHAGDRFFIQQLRDADVVVSAEANGFRLKWTTVIHSRGGKPRQRITELRFVAGPTPRQFQVAEPFEPFSERPTAWAYIDRNTLVVHVLTILADGNYELQTYERTLSGDVMTLHFVRVSSAQPELIVVGRLTRQPD